MPYAPFHDRFPEVAEKETRHIIAVNDPDLPDDEYGLLESYCDEPDCDCHRVFFNVCSWKRRECLAVIAYGWENKKFYADWFGKYDPEIVRELQGPILNPGSPQSDLAPTLLQKVAYVLKDKQYMRRIDRHYRLFKDAIANENSEPPPVSSNRKAKRNEPCPCGSGRKYKHCCGR